MCVRPAVPPKFPPLQVTAHFCRNAAIRYRLLSFTNTAQKAVSSLFVPGRSQPCLPSLYGRLKCLMSLSLQILYPKNFLLLYINFPKKKVFLRKTRTKKLAYTAVLFSHLPFGNAFNPFSSSSNADVKNKSLR